MVRSRATRDTLTVVGKRSLALEDHEEPALRWCASVAPPAALVAHLSDHGIALRTEQVAGVPVPTRVATIARDALRLAGKKASLQGRRVGVMHPDPGGADALAETLRMRGAQVAVLSLDPGLLARAEALDPEVIVVDPRHFYGACWPAAAAVFKHPQLRWACMLFSAPEVLEGSGLEAHDVPGLCAQIQLLCAEYDAAVARARVPPLFEVALEAIGPARVLRVLVQSNESWRASFTTRSLVLEVDTSEGLIVGARGGHVGQSGDDLLGTAALNVLLREHRGVVHAETVARPAVTNIMCPLDTALAGASHGRDVRESIRPRAAQGLPAPAAVLASSRNMKPRTLIGVGNPTLRPRPEEPRPASPPAESAPRASLPQEPVSWRDATLLAGIAPPPSNDQAVRASLPSAPVVKQSAAASATVATPADDNEVPTASGVLEPAEHEAAFLAIARAEAESVRALDEVLHSNRVSETSLMPVAKSPMRFAKPLAGALAAALVTLGGLALWRAPESTPLRSQAQEPPAATPSSPLPRAGSPVPGTATGAAEPSVVAPAGAAAPLAQPVAAVAPAAESAPAAELTATAAAGLAGTDDGEEADEADDDTDAPALGSNGSAPSSDAIGRAKGLARQGKVLLRKHHTAQAKEAFEAALALVPNHTRALAALAKLSLKERDAEAALRYAGSLAKMRPKSGSALLMLGDAQKLAGDTSSAIATWQQAAQRGSRPARDRLGE